MNDLLLGAAAMGSLTIALFFIRFWLRSRDVFHLFFAASFLLLAFQRVLLAAPEGQYEELPALYIPRLAAYLLIIVAVVQKNFGRRSD
jgi:hypothetical protein